MKETMSTTNANDRSMKKLLPAFVLYNRTVDMRCVCLVRSLVETSKIQTIG